MPESGGTNGQAQESPSPEGSPWVRDVFISYASQDAAVANSVVEALEQHSITCWIAPRDVIAGEFYADAIVHAIDASRVLVLILSQHASASPHILREVERASAKHHPVISLRIHQAPLPSGLEYFLNTSQWLDANNGEVTRALPKLIEAIRRAQQSGSARTATSTAALPPNKSSSPPHKAKSLITIISVLLIGAALALAVDKVWLSKHTEDAVKNAAPLSAPTMPIASAAPEKSVAVLPFVDMSEKKDQEYFSDGLAEELIDQLGKTPGLKVIARTSAFSFKGKPDDIPTIAAKLKVANILEGSVRRFGNQLRVSTQLIRAESGQALWSQTFDREFKDVFKIQDEIATAVVAALKLKLAGGQMTPGAHGTTNAEAYDAFLMARQQLIQANMDTDYRQTVAAYQKAIDLDPHYADAYAELALAQYYLGDDTGNLELERTAERMAQKAIDMDPQRPIGYTSRAQIRSFIRYDWAGAEADFKQALTLDPTDIRVLGRYASILTNVGRLEEAEAMRRKGLELDPLDDANWAGLGGTLILSGNYPAAYEALHRARALRPEGTTWQSGLGLLQLLDGHAAEALVTYQKMSFAGYRDTGVAQAEHTLGDAKASQQALDRLIATSADVAAYQIAQVYAWRGEKDKAFEWLDRAYRQQDGGLIGFKGDPLFKSLRSDPRFVALLSRLNLSP